MHKGPYFRSSPIFPYSSRSAKPTPNVLQGRINWLLVGPVTPVLLEDLIAPETSLWLTLGILNNLVLIKNDDEIARVLAWCEKNRVPYNNLVAIDGKIALGESCHFFPPEINPAPSLNHHLQKAKLEVELAAEELAPVLAAIGSRLLPLKPGLRDALNGYNLQINEFISKYGAAVGSTTNSQSPVHAFVPLNVEEQNVSQRFFFDVHGELQKITSGLSRFAAQAGTGIPPVLSHECHYWHHSALGLGTPVLGLYTLVSHIFNTLGKERIPARFVSLLNHAFPSGYTAEQKDEHVVDISTIPPDPKSLLSPLTLSLPFFSGRDGFQSNAYSVSVPLPCITASTNIRWSLCNITHEISHDIIRAILAKSLVPKRHHESVRQTLRLLIEDTNPTSVGAYIQRNFLLLAPAFAANHSFSESNGVVATYRTEFSDKLDGIEAALEKHQTDIEEVMVHAFDYIYFYQSDTGRYLEAIWSSWATIPDVKRRVVRYLLRSLCAISLHRDAETDEGYPIRELRKALQRLSKSPIVGDCCSTALDTLNRSQAGLVSCFLLQRDAAMLVKRFMFAESFLKSLHSEEGNAALYHTKNLCFPDQPFTNPLDFIKNSLTVETISPAKSAWMFACLAYNCRETTHGSSA